MNNIKYLLLILYPWTLIAQSKENNYTVKNWWNPSRPISVPQVHEDHTISFVFSAPQADKVDLLFGEWYVKPQPMEKDSLGDWHLTIGPVEPQIYSYLFKVDGLPVIDIKNPRVKTGTQVYSNVVEVPSNPPRFDQVQNIPYGVLNYHRYVSTPMKRTRGLYVYVPSEYITFPHKHYPVLYLRHGGGDDESSWTDISGKADIILENLIAKNKAQPMIIVMTNGHTDGTWAGASSLKGMAMLETELLTDVIPLVENNYRTLSGAGNRAIAGLSMGGGQSFIIGLRNTDKFSWIGEFSSGLLSAVEFRPEKYINNFYQKNGDINEAINLLWIACGTDDPRYKGHQEFSKKLLENDMNHIFHDTPGGHEWLVWRTELMHFLKQVFRDN